MRSSVWNILLYALIFILQILICNYLDIGAYIYVCLVPLIILGIPMKTNINVTMLAGFGIGLLLDIFAGGILGLNAAAATTLAAFRGPLFRSSVNRENRNKVDVPSVSSIGLNNYIVYVTLSTLVYLAVYTMLECVSLRPFFFIVFRILISLIIDTALMVIISNSLLDRE